MAPDRRKFVWLIILFARKLVGYTEGNTSWSVLLPTPTTEKCTAEMFHMDSGGSQFDTVCLNFSAIIEPTCYLDIVVNGNCGIPFSCAGPDLTIHALLNRP